MAMMLKTFNRYAGVMIQVNPVSRNLRTYLNMF